MVHCCRTSSKRAIRIEQPRPTIVVKYRGEASPSDHLQQLLIEVIGLIKASGAVTGSAVVNSHAVPVQSASIARNSSSTVSPCRLHEVGPSSLGFPAMNSMGGGAFLALSSSMS